MNKQIALRSDMDSNVLDPDDGMYAEGNSSEEFSRNLRALWSTFYRNRLVIAAITAMAILAGLGATMLMTPKFSATASIQIDQQATDVLGNDNNAVQPVDSMQDADRFLQTQTDVLQSRALAINVMQDLNLTANDDFVEHMGGKPAEQPAGTLSLVDTKREQVLKTLSSNLTVNLPRNSRVVDISFKSPDPVLAARIANAFAADFMMFNMKRTFNSSTYARTFLASQLGDTKVKLEGSERALLDYARNAGLLDVSNGIAAGADSGSSSSTPRSLTTSDLVQLNDSYAQARAARMAAQQHWLLAAATPPLQLQEVLSNPAVMQLSQLEAQARAAYQQDLQRHKPDYPQMQQSAAHITELDNQLNQIANTVRTSIKEQYLTALKQEQALAGSVSQLKSATQTEQSRSVGYNILKRAVDTNRTMYDSLLQRYAQVSAQAGVTANNISQVDVASTPSNPVSPRPLINLVLSALLGLIAAAGFVLLRDKFDDSVRTPEDVTTKLGLTFLNSTPMLGTSTSPQEALEDPRSSLSEAYAALRTAIELSHKDGSPRSLAITSTRQSEGKSTTAYAVARNFARIGQRVLLIDGDLRKPSLHKLAGIPNAKGFSNVLARMSGIEEVIQPTGIPNLFLLTAGPLPPNPAELLSGPHLPKLIAELADSFDMVIVDAPPVLGLADTILIGSVTEATLFVIEANGGHHGHAKTAVRRLAGSGIPIIGALLAKYDARKIGYGYGYGYNYAYSYSYGSNERAQISGPLKRRWWPGGR